MKHFIGRCPDIVSDIRGALARHYGRALERSAHALKFLAANLGAASAVAAAQQLEAIGGGDDWTDCPAACADVEVALAQLGVTVAALKP